MNSVRGIGPWFAAWVAGAALWMVLTDSVRASEIVAGAGVAALGATGFELVRRQRVASQAVRPDLSARLVRVLPRIVPDVWRLTRAAFLQVVERKPVRGLVVAIPFPTEADDPDERARRAVATAFGSMAPNSIVIGVDAESDLLIVHQLEATRKASDLDPTGLR
jgi:multisubunit Na+/H+ antiporter MnhE subunit